MHSPVPGKEHLFIIVVVTFTVNGLIFLLQYGHTDLM